MYVLIFVTCKDKKESAKISRELIKNRLAACVNIVDKVDSLFWWKGKVDRAKEVLLIIKSRKDKLAKIIKLVKAIHSYACPEIIALPVIAGYKPYLKWLDESVR